MPVCLNRKAKYHKTMKGLANWASTGKGYFFGLKMHITTDLNRKLLAVRFTSGNVDDRTIFLKLNKNLLGLFVADAGYISEKLQYDFYIEGKKFLFAKPKKNMKKIMTKFQEFLYGTRMLIELNFRNLKMFYGLVTSLPRSAGGYLANYIYSLLAYQIA
ncbi:MAG: transposase [Patescibacteria group bacterium]